LSPETSKPRKSLSELLNTNNFAPFVIKSEFEKLEASFQEVNQFAQEVEKEVAFILDKISDKKAIIAGTPTRLPTYGYISSPYGVRVNPYEGQRKMHEGIDIANRFGAPVFAPAFGVVSFAGNKVGYGKLVILDHGNGLETYFAHLSKYTVQIGQRIKRGQIIGSVGNSGHSTGAHLHYEVRANGLPVDPCWYILDASNVCRGRN
jgi:murein DD-endopeptidase MepM/ murein hydrolase activator NlpD